MIKNLLCLPVDSRPVSRNLPRIAGEIGGYSVQIPPVRWAGGRDMPGDITNVNKWLLSRLRKGASAVFASIDFLAFGGLVFSREPDTSLDEALKRLNILRRIKESFPETPILAFQTIPRDAVTVRDVESLRLWKTMMEKGEYPKWFTVMRKRNLEVSNRLIEMAAEGIFHTLIFAKEDVAPSSPFLAELDILRKEIRKRGLEKRAFVQNGTDEILLLLLARYICKENGTAPQIYLHLSDDEFFQRIPPYENVPFRQTLRAQAAVIGARFADKQQQCDFEIVPHFSGTTPEDIFLSQIRGKNRFGTDKASLGRTMKILKERLRSGAPVALLDCAFLNGADASLIKRLLAQNLFFRLFAYSGWNTFANRSGSLLAYSSILNAALHSHIKPRPVLLRQQLQCLTEHLLHDCIYSSIVRGGMVKLADAAGNVSKSGESKNALLQEMRNETAKMMVSYAGNNVKPVWYAHPAFFSGLDIENAYFPWGRIFEADLRAKPIFKKIQA
ncbi:MAG: DUF4127 family protein [bacterium]